MLIIWKIEDLQIKYDSIKAQITIAVFHRYDRSSRCNFFRPSVQERYLCSFYSIIRVYGFINKDLLISDILRNSLISTCTCNLLFFFSSFISFFTAKCILWDYNKPGIDGADNINRVMISYHEFYFRYTLCFVDLVCEWY